MTYRLDELAKLAAEMRLEWRRVGDGCLDVVVAPDVVLTFCNLVNDDTIVGFDGTPWHAHGCLQFETGSSTDLKCDELELLIGLGTGEIVIVTRYLHGQLIDRWLTHKDEPLDIKYIQEGEEMRILRLPGVHADR